MCHVTNSAFIQIYIYIIIIIIILKHFIEESTTKYFWCFERYEL